jgi:hypothetical protein
VAQPAASNDRLPWLSEVPRAPATPPPKQRWKFPWGAVLIGLAFAFVAVAAYYLGIRKAMTPDDQVEQPSMPLDQPYEAPQTNAVDQSIDTVFNGAIEPVSPSEQESALPRVVPQRAAPRPRIRRSGLAEVAPAAEAGEISAPIVVQPVVRGRIIQVGAYPTQYQAELAWQQLVKTWPYLATKPKLISPLDVRSTDGKATKMHRLQLATASQAQSAVICQQLEKKRQNCVVVY